MNTIFHTISEWTVAIIHSVYQFLVYQMYSILSNSLFLVLLFFIRLTQNNFIFFLVPLLFFLVSLCTQFGLFTTPEYSVSRKNYFVYYREILKRNWQLFCLYVSFIFLILFGLRVLTLYQLSLMLIPFVLTSCFLLSSMLFALLLSSDLRMNKIPLRKKLEWSLLISYRLPLVTVYNIALSGVTVFLMHYFSLAYLCFFSSVINYMVYRNLTRRFSLDLFLEEWGSKNKVS
jgi:hypothetical protein